ncbi:hypothetical protein V2J09_022512 [Rumex salicifolius]
METLKSTNDREIEMKPHQVKAMHNQYLSGKPTFLPAFNHYNSLNRVVMGRAEPEREATIPQTNNSNMYPQELQLKLYQAFIFSIPILFSIILFLLFYLFYLKKRASNLYPQSQAGSQISASNQASSFLPSASHVGIKGDLKDELHVVHFDEELNARDSQCCVCLGEFELKEELRQVAACKHVFHFDCIGSWLRNNATCPLCRCHVIISAVKQPPPQQGGVGGGSHGGQRVVEDGANMDDSSLGGNHVLYIEQTDEETVRER